MDYKIISGKKVGRNLGIPTGILISKFINIIKWFRFF